MSNRRCRARPSGILQCRVGEEDGGARINRGLLERVDVGTDRCARDEHRHDILQSKQSKQSGIARAFHQCAISGLQERADDQIERLLRALGQQYLVDGRLDAAHEE